MLIEEDIGIDCQRFRKSPFKLDAIMADPRQVEKRIPHFACFGPVHDITPSGEYFNMHQRVCLADRPTPGAILKNFFSICRRIVMVHVPRWEKGFNRVGDPVVLPFQGELRFNIDENLPIINCIHLHPTTTGLGDKRDHYIISVNTWGVKQETRFRKTGQNFRMIILGGVGFLKGCHVDGQKKARGGGNLWVQGKSEHHRFPDGRNSMGREQFGRIVVRF